MVSATAVAAKTTAAVSDNSEPSAPLTVLNIMTTKETRHGWPTWWACLGRTDRSWAAILAEFIDNAVAELAFCGGYATVVIELGGTWTKGQLDLSSAWLRVRDNATGMPLDKLEKCLAMGELATESSTSLHEHGMGMKTALVCLCADAASLQHIVTKRADQPTGYRFAYVNDGYAFGEIPVTADTEIFAANERGTEIFIRGLATGMYRTRAAINKHWVQTLSFKYARLLAGENILGHKIDIIVRLCDADGQVLDTGKDNKAEWRLAPIVQRYKGGSRPTVDRVTFSGPSEVDDVDEDWEVQFELGRAAQQSEFDSAGIPAPPQNHPCHSFQRRFHIVMHNRVLASLPISAFGGCDDSNQWVPYTGVVTLIRGFKTTHEKDGVVPDGNWQAMTARLYKHMMPFIQRWAQESKQNEVTEAGYRDAYAQMLRSPAPGSDVVPKVLTEHAIAGGGGRIDLLYYMDTRVDHCIVIELKAVAGTLEHVFQLFGYMCMFEHADKKRGRLIAESFTDACVASVEKLFELYEVTIEMVTLRQAGLTNVVTVKPSE